MADDKAFYELKDCLKEEQDKTSELESQFAKAKKSQSEEIARLENELKDRATRFEEDTAAAEEKSRNTWDDLIATRTKRDSFEDQLGTVKQETDRLQTAIDGTNTVLSNTKRDHTQAMDETREEHTQALNEAKEQFHDEQAKHDETRQSSATKSKLIAWHLSLLHSPEVDSENLINELSGLLEKKTQDTGLAHILATKQPSDIPISPSLFPDPRRLDFTNTNMEDGLALVADVSGIFILFALNSGVHIFRECLLLRDEEILLVSDRRLLGLPKKLMTTPLNGRKLNQKRWDVVWSWRKAYLEGNFVKMESGFAEEGQIISSQGLL